jgi:hypothetical protein
MAKQKVNKSAAIREAIQANPKAKAKEIVEVLGGKGIKVAVPLAYYIKSHSKKVKRKAKRARVLASANGHSDAVTIIVGLKQLALQAGGIGNLKKIVDAMAE